MSMVRVAEEAVREVDRLFYPKGYGDGGYQARLKNGAVVGQCECGGEVKRVYSSRARVGELVCLRCGTVNPRFRRVELDDEEVVRAMRTAYEEISRRLGEQELDGQAWLRVVEFLLGQSIPTWLWRKEAERWLEKAGLEIVMGYVRRREEE